MTTNRRATTLGIIVAISNNLMKVKERILHIEDDALFRCVMGQTLRMENFEVDEASCGEDGLEAILSEVDYDLVLLDLELPDQTGVEILQEIRRYYSQNDLPVIMLSGEGNSQKIIDALNAGANDYVCKPVDSNVLIARIKVNLQVHQNHEESITREQNRVMKETIGAACHHISQSITAAVVEVEMLVRDGEASGSKTLPQLESLRSWIKESGKQILRLQRVKEYRSVTYESETNIIDVDDGTTCSQPPTKG
ncbi:MAG: DNA-binding response OmpR family regulator [Kiritimatiellia bacterium]